MDRLPSLIPDTYIKNMARIASECPPGIFVEVGVYKGGSAQYLYETARAQNRDLYLFDTFSGMPYVGPSDTNFVGEFADGAEFLEQIRSRMPKAHIHVGIFPETLPALPPIAFVHADGDIEQTTTDILTLLYPKIVPGGAILFDDYPFNPGCRAAVDGFLVKNPDLKSQMSFVPHGLLRK